MRDQLINESFRIIIRFKRSTNHKDTRPISVLDITKLLKDYRLYQRTRYDTDTANTFVWDRAINSSYPTSNRRTGAVLCLFDIL